MPVDNVEACGVNNLGTFSTGYITMLPLDEADYFKSIDCQLVSASFDPNDKRGFPTGVGLDKFITKNDEIEYMIRFQNTGTDTAFRIIIRDTLDTDLLDVSTIINGVSSHPHQFTIYGQGILKWTFDPIALVDSNTNEPLSHGFVKFKVQQQPNNPLGTVIENKASIYFDYNAPVITNTEYHTIGEDFLEIRLESGLGDILKNYPEFDVNVYPNPFSTQATVDLKGMEGEQIRFELFDIMGRTLRTYELEEAHSFPIQRGELSKGTYLFKMTTETGKVATGKLIVY